MLRTATALCALLVAAPTVDGAPHDVESHLSPSGVAFVSDNLAAQIPAAIDPAAITATLYSCSGDDATATQRDTHIDLDIAAASLTQPAPGTLRLELELSASMTGEIHLDKPFVCTGELTCKDTATLSGARAYLDLGDAVDDDGTRRLAVTYADLVIDPASIDLSLSDCAASDLANTVIDAVKGVAVDVAREAVIDLAENHLGALLQGALAGLAAREAAVGPFSVSTDLVELDLTAGVRVAGEVDVRSSAPAPTCFADPGEPEPQLATRPKLLGGTQADLGLSINLGLINDLLYNLWKVGARCGGYEIDASFAGLYLTDFPDDTRFELRTGLAAPPEVLASTAGLILLFPDVELELRATEPSGRERLARARLAAEAQISMGIEPRTASLGFAVDSARITRIDLDDEHSLSGAGFDAERIRQLANDHYLPRQLDQLLNAELTLPLGVSAAGLHGIARELSTVSGYLVVKADLFAEPASDTNAPDTEITEAPAGTVSPEDAIVSVTGSDPEIPTELLRYRVVVDGIDYAEVSHGRVALPIRGVTARRRVEIAAVDLAGNVDPSPAVVELTIDGIRPDVSIETAGDEIRWAASDDTTAAAALEARVEVIELGSGQVIHEQALAAGASSATLPDLDGRDYRVVVYVADAAGNEGVASAVLARSGGCSAAGSDAGWPLVLVALLVAFGLRRRVEIAALCALGCGAAAEAPAPIELPDCASDLGRAMWASMPPVADNATIPLELSASAAARIDPRVYISGPEIWGRWAELIETAEREINMQFYKWEPDTDPTATILAGLEALSARRRALGATEALPVRVVIDTSTIGAAAPITGEHMPEIMRQVSEYDIDARVVDLVFAVDERGLLDGFGNLHVKSMVVDRRVGMLTGANPEHQHNFDRPWHDIAASFAGDITAGVTADFEYSWDRSQRWSCGAGESGEHCLTPVAPLPELPLGASSMGEAACSVLALTREPSQFVNNSVDNPQDQAFLAGFYNAREVIEIETPNINDDAVKEALLDAVVRGVTVRVITSKEFNETAEKLAGGPNGENVDELYRDVALAGVADPCSRLQIRWYSRDGVAPILGNVEYASHTKYASIDEQVVIVGTTNMDTASWNFSHELNLAIDDASITAAFNSQLFDADWERALPVDQCR
jgi:MYXO-CTERM domain-containing protein